MADQQSKKRLDIEAHGSIGALLSAPATALRVLHAAPPIPYRTLATPVDGILSLKQFFFRLFLVAPKKEESIEVQLGGQ